MAFGALWCPGVVDVACWGVVWASLDKDSLLGGGLVFPSDTGGESQGDRNVEFRSGTAFH